MYDDQFPWKNLTMKGLSLNWVVTMKLPEWFYHVTLWQPCNLIMVKTCLYILQLAPVTISVHKCQLYGSCADKRCFCVLLQKWVVGF